MNMAVTVECPRCGSTPSILCRTKSGRSTKPHQERELAYRQARTEAMLDEDQLENLQALVRKVRNAPVMTQSIACYRTTAELEEMYPAAVANLLASAKDEYADLAAVRVHGGVAVARLVAIAAGVEWLRGALLGVVP